MNRLLLLFISLLLVVTGCRKSAERYNGGLTGKWIFVGSYYSIGGPQIWSPAQTANQTIDFKPDGTVNSTVSNFEFAKYEMVDSTKIKVMPASTPSGYILMSYTITAADGKLVLWPVEPACIEGCSYQFKRED